MAAHVNTKIPRIYIAATRQNDGKTTACIGLMSILRKRFKRLGFIKPVGQRYVEVDGHRIDADAVLMQDVYGSDTDLHDMMVKIKPGEYEKIKLVQKMYEKHFKVDRLLEQLS